ncbi:hypothetical protein FHY30_003432 [Xanthomonas arboricola]|nr:hypothetical protein [Xanthomonas campestris]
MAKHNPLAETLCNKPASLSPKRGRTRRRNRSTRCLQYSARSPVRTRLLSNSNGQPELAVTTTLRDESLIPFPTLPDQSA